MTLLHNVLTISSRNTPLTNLTNHLFDNSIKSLVLSKVSGLTVP
jgi:hypothetical protein